ncbi:P-loop NTPase fold protein [Lactobacillus apis]|uniref:P-loop NTPase fold protein n=1 Tax=Lactobacillus apis TaxID=303541 RepID=UPI0027409CB1|nr:P-loop NTPase fold protein [Lactobacillus apis]WLS84812.1 P-loop NTPase fold protein [Lactobacillus apis]
MNDNKWKIDHIDTSSLAKKFAELLEQDNNKTYFLQGTWGSGKTEYLKEVENQSKGKLRFVYLKLWKPKSNESIANMLFSAIHPWISQLFSCGVLVYVIITILASTWLSLVSIFSSSNLFSAFHFLEGNRRLFLCFTVIAIILSSLFGFLKTKALTMDKLLMYLSLCSLRNGVKRTKILVVDDFDRIDTNSQRELYKIFNAIQEKNNQKHNWLTNIVVNIINHVKSSFGINSKKDAPHEFPKKSCTIFVGNLDNIDHIENNYLRKIIDQIISLPYTLNPQSFSPTIETIISDNLQENVSINPIIDLFITEHRTLRDANQFLSYVKDEFFRQDKRGRIQTDQQLFIIYLYLFHKNHYKALYENWKKQKQKRQQQKLKQVYNTDPASADSQKQNKTKLDQYIDLILSDEKKFPIEYQRNQTAYFINELVTNYSIAELNKISYQPASLKKLFSMSENNSTELYKEFKQYIEYMPKQAYAEVKPLLDTMATITMNSEPRHFPNYLVRLVFQKQMQIIYDSLYKGPNYSEEEQIDIYLKAFAEYFKKTSPNTNEAFPLTKQLFIYRRCLPIFGTYINNDPFGGKGFEAINRFSLTKHFSESAKNLENRKDFGKQLYDAEALLVQLGFSIHEINYYKEVKLPTIESKVKKIEQLSDFEYLSFWDTYLGSLEVYKNLPALNFSYEGRPYYNTIKQHYYGIIELISSYFRFNENENLNELFHSSKWCYFVLRIDTVLNLSKLSYTQKKLCIRSKVNRLLKRLNITNLTLKEMEQNNLSKEELYFLNTLLEYVINNPDWTSDLNN